MTLVLDANLLVLLVVGLVGEELISKHKRLNAYDVTDFRRLRAIVAAAPKLLFVPHILAETSNLIRHVDEPRRTEFMLSLGALIEATEERPVASRTVVHEAGYCRLGLTDAVLLSLLDGTRLLLTVDLHLYLEASKAGAHAVNFNHERGF